MLCLLTPCALPCVPISKIYFSTYRPDAGNINFCPGEIIQYTAEELITITIHELAHILVQTGMNSTCTP